MPAAQIETDLSEHEVTTVADAGLYGVKNGRLLAAIEGQCDCFITMDKNMRFQQQLSGHGFSVVILRASTNRLIDLQLLAPALRLLPGNTRPGQIYQLPDNFAGQTC